MEQPSHAKVLIIRFSSIGDIVLTTPVIRCVKQQLAGGNNTVHFLTKKTFLPVLRGNPYIDEIKTIDKSTSEIIDNLRDEEYDYVFDLHNNLRSARVKRSLNALSFSFNKLNIQKWIYVNFKVNKMPDVHIVDRYMGTTEAFGVKNDGKGLDYFIPEGEELDFSKLPDGFTGSYIAFAIGGRHPGKKLPEDKITEVCKRVSHNVILLGGEEDRSAGDRIVRLTGTGVFNACGKLALNESADVIRRADAVITHDTGLMHIAAAFKKKVISIWGATVPELGMSPYMPGPGSVIIEPDDVKGRPYSKLGDNKWYKRDFKGMEKIDTDAVIRAVEG